MSNQKERRPHFKIGLILIVVGILVIVLTRWQDRSLVEAEAQLQAGDAQAAAKTLDAFLSGRPNHQRGKLLKARTLVELQQWSEADDIFSQTGADSPAELKAWATALMHQGKWPQALPLLEQVSRTGRTDAEALRDLTICRYQLGQADPALDSATQLAALPDHQVEGLFHQGVIHGAVGNTHLAIECWEQIEQLAPQATGLAIQPAAFFRGFAEDLMIEARPRQALAYLQRSLELQPNVEVRTQLGEAWYRVGKFDEATEAWTAVLKEDQDNQEARLGLAELALDNNNPEAAIEWLAPIATEQQASEAAAYMMQRAHTLLGDEELAAQWQSRVAKLRRSRKLQAAFEERAK